MVRVRRSAESAHRLRFVCSCSAMASSMFCELATLDAVALAAAGGDNGTVHRVTVSVAYSATCSFASDAPAGCWVVLRQAPLGEVLPHADVLLVAVQAADTMFVLRAITRKTFNKAVELEAFDRRDSGSADQAVMLAAALLPDCVLRTLPARPLTGNASRVEHYARRMELELEQSGDLAGRFGLPVELLARGGIFPAELPAVVQPHVAELERRAAEIRAEIAMLSPAREVPLSERVPPAQPAVRTARDAIAAWLLEGTPSHSSPAYRPLHFDVGAIEAAAAGGVPPEPEAPQEGYVADATAPPAAASPAVVPLAAVPAAQAAAAGLPAQPAVAPHTGRSSARSYGSISSAAARELQRQAGERCVELVSARVPEAAARQLAEAGCDLDAFWAMPEADVVAACTGLPPLQVALLRRAHGRGVDGGPPASRPASRAAGSRPASRAGSAAGDGTVPQLPPLQRASPAPTAGASAVRRAAAPAASVCRGAASGGEPAAYCRRS